MPILNYENLTPDLEPLDKVKINLEGIKLLQLRSDFNQDEVEGHFIPFVAKRMYAYQVLRFLDFLPEHKSDIFSTNSELIEDHTSQINKEAGLPEKIDFWKFTASIKDTLKNDYKKVNNGEDSISVDWMLSCCFLQLTELKDVLLVNQEDLPFKEQDGCYFGRSVLAVVIQEYISNFSDIAMKNFNILEVENEDSKIQNATVEHLSKQRDIHLKRDQALDHLKSLKCQKTGKTGLDILSTDFEILTK
tara:strand:- start:60 stop:800 length:741 start_codon:yes stop_codon:yes gene_type:complete